jgi:Spy/CpxP family protein refolding chaperone
MRTTHLPIVIAATAVIVLLFGITAVLAAPRGESDDPGWSHDEMHAEMHAEMRAQMPAEMAAECDAMRAQMGDHHGSRSRTHAQMPGMSGETGGMMGDSATGQGPMGGRMVPPRTS